MTLNLLRMSSLNPQLFAYSQLWGNFSFNHTLIAPMSTTQLIHLKPLVRETLTSYTIKGWYLIPTMQHYWCFRLWTE